MGSLPCNIKHIVNNVTCSVKHFEWTDTVEKQEHGELTFIVALEQGRSQDKLSSAVDAAAVFSLMCFPLLLLLNDMLVFFNEGFFTSLPKVFSCCSHCECSLIKPIKMKAAFHFCAACLL